MAKSKTPSWHKHLLPKQAESINSVAISGDGSRVVAGTYFFTNGNGSPTSKTVGLFAFDGKGKSLWPSPDTYSATFGINWVSISRDGSWAASGGQIASNSGFINAYDVASGTKLLTYNTPARVQMVALNKDGSCLVAGGDSLYVFARAASTSTWSPPQSVKFPTGTVERVAVSDDGKWIAAAVNGGVVSLVQNDMGAGGGLSAPASWAASAGWIMWVAMAADGSGFVVAGSNSTVYYFDISAFAASPTATISPTWQFSLTGCTACRSVAINDNGSLISAVADVPTQPATGKVFLIANQGNTGKQLWSTNPTTSHGVNSTSIDAAGQYITVADGNPAANVGDFYLFDATSGNLIWSYNTKQMNWPMQISADASAVAAGSDDGNVYYFAVP
jgi:hypothetical protein